MTDAADFKKLAERCLAQANKATSAQERQSHVESAMVWSRLAEQEDELWRIDQPLAKAPSANGQS